MLNNCNMYCPYDFYNDVRKIKEKWSRNDYLNVDIGYVFECVVYFYVLYNQLHRYCTMLNVGLYFS